MGNNRLHAFRLNKYAYIGVDASNKESVHLFLQEGGLPESMDDALEGTAVQILRDIAQNLTVSEGLVMVDGKLAESYLLDTNILDALRAICDLSAKVSYRYQRVRSLSMQAELPLGTD